MRTGIRKQAAMACAARIGLGAALSVLALGACDRDTDANAAEAAPPATVTVGAENIVVAETTQLHSGPLISGSLEPEWSATVRAEVAGAVLQTSAEQGERVGRGALLARIDDAAIRDAYLSARSAVGSAEVSASLAQRNAERSETLAGAGAIADRDVEAARSQAAAATAQLADARARFALAEQQLAKTRVRAPGNGVVSAREVQAGDVVQPGSAMFTVVDPTRMKLEASVPAAEIAAVRVGDPVEFTVTGYERAFSGRVERINPVADPATGQVRIQVGVPNTGASLVGGLFAQGRVASET
ncbi:MAG: efflux RND transporter periplasmic adaptor subunit, partial [Gemmatimonadota bacterium]|nr:efflux RND transporter periplasmic adaptor subunit [Gemmatimonadota bacterium]